MAPSKAYSSETPWVVEWRRAMGSEALCLAWLYPAVHHSCTTSPIVHCVDSVQYD